MRADFIGYFRETPLRLFLQASMLSSEGDQSKEGENEVYFQRS